MGGLIGKNKVHPFIEPQSDDDRSDGKDRNTKTSQEILHVTADFRLLVVFQYLLIGGADTSFWWSVWLLSNHFFSPSITQCGYSFLRGYILIITANLAYLFVRSYYSDTCAKNYDHHQQVNYPALFLTYSRTTNKHKPFKFKLLTCAFSLCVYILVVGYIQVWIGLFEIFNFIIDVLLVRYNVNRVLSSILFQLVVGVSLAFTRQDNAVNLCPTHEMFHTDEQQYLDKLFNVNAFRFFTRTPTIEEATLLPREKIADSDFDIVEYFTRKLLQSLPSFSKDLESSTLEEESHMWEIVLETNSFCKYIIFPHKFNGTVHPAVEIVNVEELDDQHCKYQPREKQQNKCLSVSLNSPISKASTTEKQTVLTVDNLTMKRGTVLTADNLTKEQEEIAEALIDTLEERHSLTSVQKGKIYQIISRGKHTDQQVNKSEKVSNRKYMFIETLGYFCAIHHRQVFLHIFGGMFWSTTWKLFDIATHSTFVKKPNDLPGLALIAFLCYCLNHLVLFRFKETASQIYWKTFYEFLCGILTVSLWASTWYMLDIVTTPIGKPMEVQVLVNTASFLGLAFSGVSINIAL